jgi:amino acid permease (GABA permease)
MYHRISLPRKAPHMSNTDAISAGRRHTALLDDDATLHALGYPRKLARRMSAFDNFGVSFTIISILSGCLTLYGFGMNTGGPAALIWGWLGVGLMVLFVGLAMAEVCSAYPTSGGLYFWSAKLAPKHSAAWAWYTGWFNLLGQVAVTAGIDFGAATFIGAFASLQWGYTPHPKGILLIYAAVLLLHGLLNTFSVRLVAILNRVSVWWHVLGVTTIVVALAVVPSHHQSASFVFTHFVNNTGWGSAIYVSALSVLVAQYTFTGYDASAHMTEETTHASVAAPKGIVRSIYVSWIAGFVLLLGVTFAIQNYSAELATSTGVPPAQIFIDAVGSAGGRSLLMIAIVAQLFCGMSSVTANSRMIFAFSRDGALPGSQIWYKVNTRTKTPTNAVWLAVVAAFILAVPDLYSSVAYGAVTSIATIGLYVAYIIPILLRRRLGNKFENGPWNLGKWSAPIGWISIVWVTIITVLFLLPEDNPITRDNFNYAPVAVGVVLIIATAWWFATARRTFKGPVSYGSPEDLAALEAEVF